MSKTKEYLMETIERDNYIASEMTFEEFLMDKCPSHTNNSPEGFEKWEENLDIQEVEDYAQEFVDLIRSKIEGLSDDDYNPN